MEHTRHKKWAALLAAGLLFGNFGTCLPEDYLALSVRSISVTIADSILAAAISPILDAINPDDADADNEDTEE
ncbi:MAG: hypothetical protein JSU63_18460 [Phycisphaerales bacterium]|nr:MAG: hypothetical protein JSU63_18460 [Phycisphaerales bacterium]